MALWLFGPRSQTLTRCICQAPGAVQQLGNGSFFLRAASHWGLVTVQGSALSYVLTCGWDCSHAPAQPVLTRGLLCMCLRVRRGYTSLCELHAFLSRLLKLGWVSELCGSLDIM